MQAAEQPVRDVIAPIELIGPEGKVKDGDGERDGAKHIDGKNDRIKPWTFSTDETAARTDHTRSSEIQRGDKLIFGARSASDVVVLRAMDFTASNSRSDCAR